MRDQGTLQVASAYQPTKRSRQLERAAVVVEVRDVVKTFRMPDRRVDTLKERVVHPTRKIASRELRALKGSRSTSARANSSESWAATAPARARC